jgi:hypothetical protein
MTEWAQCQACEGVDEYVSSKMRGMFCTSCGGKMVKTGYDPRLQDGPKRRVTNQQKRSRDQERRLAKTFGMQQQAASGALPNVKSDLRDAGKLRGEAKETTKKSFSLKIAELEKLEKEARGGELPLFMIEFQGVHPHKRYVVMPEWVALSLLER